MNNKSRVVHLLHNLVSTSKITITDDFTLTADNVFKSLDAEGVPREIKRLTTGDWDLESATITDEEIFEKMSFGEAGHQGVLTIHTAACSKYGIEDFSCDADQLKSFIMGYDIEMFFDGDVIMLCEESRTITIYHHEGYFAHIKM